MSDPTARRVPRAGLDPITDASAALEVVRLAVHIPPRPETIVVLLDPERCGTAITVVADTRRPDDVLEVVECVGGAAAGTGVISGLIVASVRPCADGADHRDVDRWLEMSDTGRRIGAPVVEWFVLGHRTVCPRDLLGEPPRW